MGIPYQNSLQSKADQTMKISKSVFVSNFPDGFTTKDLWKICNDYGTVVDVFIPNKRTKVGKRFAFVRFIKVNNLDRLIENLNTIWIGRFHLFANPVRFERPNKPTPSARVDAVPIPKIFKGTDQAKVASGSYVNVTSGKSPASVYGPHISPAPVLVLDESCVVEHDLSNHVMGKVKDANVISNLRNLLMDEGFDVGNMVYLGGLWVMFDCEKEETKAKLIQHTGVNSWFSVLKNAIHDFVSEERIVWVDIEGIPLNLWSIETFKRIAKKWGEVVDIEDNVVSSFGRKRICIKTKHHLSILESFKIIFKGKVYMVRAKELFTWCPTFLGLKEGEYKSDDESDHGSIKVPAQSNSGEVNSRDDELSDIEEVSETVFGNNSPSPTLHSADAASQESEDPFNIYGILNKSKKGTDNHETSSSMSHPPGFTPVLNVNHSDKEAPVEVSANVLNNSHDGGKETSSKYVQRKVVKNGGSVLDVMEDMIRVGKAMGFSMEGSLGHKTKKEWIKELSSKNKINFMAIQETKSQCVTHMDVKFMWGNSNYDYVHSEAIGNSGGILCVWETSVFKKDYATLSDNFIAIYGTGYLVIPSRWNGEVIMLGDFNEVRNIDERRGSVFNPASARVFNNFILTSGLVDVKMEGYAFTWSHPSGSKMSKLDRFLVSEGIFTICPAITAICLEMHLSDHRPIILCEVHADFGPTPFRFYHSWFNLEGFDTMVEQQWRSFSHNDSNKMIRFKKKLQALKIRIRSWVKDQKLKVVGDKNSIKNELIDIDRIVDSGTVSDTNLIRRAELHRKLHEINSREAKDYIQKSKVKWAIEGDENSKFFHGLINKKRSQLAIRGIFVDGTWCTNPTKVKEAFLNHFEARFKKPDIHLLVLNFTFDKRLSNMQAADLDRVVSRDEIRLAELGLWGE
ncbi:RNA-directed DNA polymerase, eukaryota [Tanacetum coccineum]